MKTNIAYNFDHLSLISSQNDDDDDDKINNNNNNNNNNVRLDLVFWDFQIFYTLKLLVLHLCKR